jgi:dTDP-4-dehydrorhamnose reductase
LILVFGQSGQIAQAFQGKLPEIELFGRDRADFANTEMVIETLNKVRPELVINAAAYTAVDRAETERDQALLINSTTVGEIAQWCHRHQTPLIHYSTDYVFTGNGTEPLLEDATKGPLNWYGMTKLKAERAITESGCAHLIFRISWVYSHVGNNFVRTMLKLGAEKTELKIVADQVGSPTCAEDVAEATLKVIALHRKDLLKIPRGIYHMSGGKSIYDNLSWYDFAHVIFKQARTIGFPIRVENILPVTTAEYPTAAKRPLNSRLNADKFFNTFGFSLPTWQTALPTCLRRIYESR